MPESNTLDRQSILNHVYEHFIANRQPAGRESSARCVYHCRDRHNQQVSCAIGIFDSDNRLDFEELADLSIAQLHDVDPDALCNVFGQSELSGADLEFLSRVQNEHDLAVQSAVASKEEALSNRSFDALFLEELAHRLDRFAREKQLDSPCTPRDLGAA